MRYERLKHIADIRISSVDKKTLEDDAQIRLCNYTDVYYNERITGDLDFMVATATPDQRAAFELRTGDVVLTKDSETADDIGVSALIAEEVSDLVCGYHLAIVRASRNRAIGGYLRWALASLPIRQRMSASATGVTRFGLRSEAIADLLTPAPSLATQQAIADYLDNETARIDALIAAKRRMMELLEERFWSWVNRQVDRHGTSYLPLRRFLTRIIDGPFGSSLTSSDYSESGARVVRLGNIGRGRFRNEDIAYISSKYFQTLLRHRVMEGDLVIAGLGDTNNHVGRACVAPKLGLAIVKADCYCASVNPARGLAEFLALFLSSPLGAKNVAMAARGTTRSRINLDIAREIEIPVLSLSMQSKITAAAVIKRRRCDELLRTLQLQTDLLQERRQALITAAVTGQLEIPEKA